MKKETNPKDPIGAGKWRQFFVVPAQVMWEVGVGMFEGAVKYGRHNYRVSGVRASIYIDAAKGHIDQWVEGEDIDPDSGLSHITKAICSLVVLRDAMMNDFFVDDRPPKVKDLATTRARLQGVVDEILNRHSEHAAAFTHTENAPPYYTPCNEHVEVAFSSPVAYTQEEVDSYVKEAERNAMMRVVNELKRAGIASIPIEELSKDDD